MRHRHNKNRCMIYPEEKFKQAWDLLITVALMVACISSPLDIAFASESKSIFDNKLSLIIDIIFTIDIIIIFNTAFYTTDMETVDDRCKIIVTYLTGWFVMDLLSVIPFDILLDGS
jgi:hypothetical protein